MSSTEGTAGSITDRYPGLRHIMIDFNQMKAFIDDPLVIVEGAGVRVRDQDDRWYIDGIAGIAAVQLGHGNRPIIDAMTAQLEQVALTLPVQGANEPELELAERLAEITPPGLTTVKFFSGGSEANEAAIKLARQYHRQTGRPDRYKVISRYKSYHGATLGALAASGGAARKQRFEPFPAGFVHVHPPECYQCPFRLTYPDCGVLCAEVVEEVILGESPETVAAVIAEPVIFSSDGFVVAPPEYFKILRDICDRHGVLLLLDEIITGFGRLGERFGAEVYGVAPDMLSMGKGLSGGYAPLAAVIMTDEIAQAFWGERSDNLHFNAGHTYAGNPVASAAGLASVEQITADGFLDEVRRKGARLRAHLDDIAMRHEVIGNVSGHGLMYAVEFVKDRETHGRFPAEQLFARTVYQAAKDGGLIARLADHYTALTPPLSSTDAEIDEMAEILDAAIAESLETLE